MSKRLLPTGNCWCGCGVQIDLGSFFAPGHDKKAESRVIMEVFGGVPQFLVAFGYGPDGVETGATWIDNARLLLGVHPTMRGRFAVEYPDPADRTGRLLRTGFQVQLGKPDLNDGAAFLTVPGRGEIVVPFADIAAVYRATDGWVVRTTGGLDPKVGYVAFARDEPRSMTAKGVLRLKELGPVKDAAMEAWRRITVEHVPGLHVPADKRSQLPMKDGYERWDGFTNAVTMISIPDTDLAKHCNEFAQSLGNVDDCWFSARQSLRRAGTASPTPSEIYARLVADCWGQIKGETFVNHARTAYDALLRHLEALLA